MTINCKSMWVENLLLVYPQYRLVMVDQTTISFYLLLDPIKITYFMRTTKLW
jgi:hypothetical protein